MGRIKVWARPGSCEDRIAWDEWRKRWVVSCREPPTEGRANEATLRMIAERLGVSRNSVSFVTSGRARAKLIEVDGLSDSEIATRLHHSSSAGA